MIAEFSVGKMRPDSLLGMDQLDTTRKIEIGLSRWSMVFPLIVSLVFVCVAASTLFRWDFMVFESNSLIVDLLIEAALLLLKLVTIWAFLYFAAIFGRLAGLAVFHRGPAVTISPVGIFDSRIQSVEIPWESILSIAPMRQMRTKYLLLTVDPVVFESVVSKETWLSTIYRWLTLCRRSEGDSRIQISPVNLQITDDDFLNLISAYVDAYGPESK